ncbi:MAG TPA: P22 phage major capsid protein family protein [Pseudonocardia sp.]|nr:P22 phage major capsid protein family protein [Pseudonocardia sp.]
MANTFIKATRVAAAALGLLEREIVLPGLVWRDAGGDFRGAGGDTITIKVPARTQARTRPLRGARPAASEGTGIITMDELTQTSVDVSLDTDVYNAIPVTDEELTLDIVDFGMEVLEPQVRAVAEGVENAVVAEMTGATYATSLTIDTADPYKTLVDAHVALNKANVPRSERFAVVGADIEAVILKSDHLSRVDQSGSDAALRRAEIGQLARFPIYVSNALPSNVGFAFHRTAYVLGMRAPMVPDGATFGASRSAFGLALRWLRDYDFRNVQDRSLVDTYIGTSHVADGPDGADADTDPDFVRAVKLTLA